MKTLIIVAFFQCVFLHLNLVVLSESLVDANVHVEARNRNSRILSTFAKEIKGNTAQVVAKIENIVLSTNNITDEIDTLSSMLNSSHAETIVKLNVIQSSLTSGADLVKAVETAEKIASDLLDALTNSSRNGTVLQQLTSLYNLLDTKLSNLEKIAGFDDYPTTTVAATTAGQTITTVATTTTAQATTTTTATTTVAVTTTTQATATTPPTTPATTTTTQATTTVHVDHCVSQFDCFASQNGKYCNNNICEKSCSSDYQCQLLNESNTFICRDTGDCFDTYVD